MHGIGILVTSTSTGPGGSVVSALASQQMVGGSTPSCGKTFFPQNIFLSYFSNLNINGHMSGQVSD